MSRARRRETAKHSPGHAGSLHTCTSAMRWLAPEDRYIATGTNLSWGEEICKEVFFSRWVFAFMAQNHIRAHKRFIEAMIAHRTPRYGCISSGKICLLRRPTRPVTRLCQHLQGNSASQSSVCCDAEQVEAPSAEKNSWYHKPFLRAVTTHRGKIKFGTHETFLTHPVERSKAVTALKNAVS